MTEESSVLKTKLGLENLQGLGETLKQIKDVKESLDEAQKTIAELTKDNSPLGRALARLIEAQGLKTLNEDSANVLEEVRKNMGETIKELEAENKDLKEEKVIREVTDSVKTELDRRLPQAGEHENGSGAGKLFKALENVVADYLEKRLLGSGGEGSLSSEQIRNIIKDEVGQVAGGHKKPEDMVDDIVSAVTMGDRLREKLGLPGIGGHYLSASGEGSSLRTDLVKVLLEDERERLKIQNEKESSEARNKHIATLVGTFKENAEDIIGATRDLTHMLDEERKPAGEDVHQEQPEGFGFKCGQCGNTFTLDEEPQGEFPCPGCGAKLQIKKPGPKVASSLEI
jgi:DNA-directed RNA polymerase subunit RPC12/RpoP